MNRTDDFKPASGRTGSRGAVFIATGVDATVLLILITMAAPKDGIGWFLILAMFFVPAAAMIHGLSFAIVGLLAKRIGGTLPLLVLLSGLTPVLVMFLIFSIPHLNDLARFHPTPYWTLQKQFWNLLSRDLEYAAIVGPGGAVGAALLFRGTRED